MNQRRSFHNKIIYGLGIAFIIWALYALAAPAVPTDPDSGGVLAKLQKEYGLAQTSLGEVDPASETMKLATLGLRGIATQLLWNQANKAKTEENWTQLTATLRQLANLQPNYITFWKFQSWNVSYNVSVQFDDYRDRYFYVREGIKFLQQGIDYNRENSEIPQLRWDLGWFFGQKIGRADEYVQYRRLFKNDDEFHGDRLPADRDNWLMGKHAYQDAIDSVVVRLKSLGKKSEKIFYASPAKSQMSYSEAIEEEGEFEQGQRNWVQSEKEWREFGDRAITHSTGIVVYLGGEEATAKRITELEQEFETFAPGVKQRLLDEKRAKLIDAQRQALDTPEADRNEEQAALAYQVQEQVAVSDEEIATAVAAADPNKKIKAFDLAGQLSLARLKHTFTQRYKSEANYDYWLVRSQFEQTPDAVAARENMFQGKQALRNGDRVKAIEFYEAGFLKWKAVLEAFPVLMDPEATTGDDLLVFIEEYRDALNADDRTFPENFPLWDIIEDFDREEIFAEELREHKLQSEAAQPNGNAAGANDSPADAGTTEGDAPAAEASGDAAAADPAEATEASEGDATEGSDAPANLPSEPPVESTDAPAAATP